MNMKVALIGQKGFPTISGGVERHVETLSRELAKRRVSVVIYARPWYQKLARGTGKIPRGIEIVTLKSLHTKMLDAITHTFLSTIHAMKTNVDIINYHGVGPSLLSWIPRIVAPHIKVVATFHCLDRKHEKWGVIARTALRIGEWVACKAPHATIVISKELQKYTREHYGAETTLIPYIAPSLGPGNANVLKRFHLKPKRYAVFVSRLVRHKNAHLLIAAWRLLPDTIKKDYKLVMVGESAFTDSYVKKLRALAQSDRSIIFAGNQKGAPGALVRKAALFVHPSSSEGTSLAVLEAMHASVPVLLANIPESLELLGRGARGFLFRDRDLSDLRNELARVLTMPSAERGAVAARGHEYVSTYFSKDKIARLTLQLFDELLYTPDFEPRPLTST